MPDFTFCPNCGNKLNPVEVDGKMHLGCAGDDDGWQRPRCRNFIHWNNPAPCVAVLLPVLKLSKDNLPEKYWQKNKFETGGGLQPNAVVLVQRGVEPFKGMWCLPCGFMDSCEDPWAAAKREAKEEAMADIEYMQLLDACAPPAEEGKPINQLILFYMARLVGGGDVAGDDAAAVGWFMGNELPDIAFSTHQKVIDDYFNGRWTYKGNVTASIRLN